MLHARFGMTQPVVRAEGWHGTLSLEWRPILEVVPPLQLEDESRH